MTKIYFLMTSLFCTTILQATPTVNFSMENQLYQGTCILGCGCGGGGHHNGDEIPSDQD